MKHILCNPQCGHYVVCKHTAFICEEFVAIQKRFTGLQLFLLHHFVMLHTKHVCLMLCG